MIKDATLKTILLPLCGIMLPLLTGLYIYSRHSTFEVIFSNTLFLLFSFCIWQVTVAQIAAIRNWKWSRQNIIHRISMQSVSILFTALIASGLFALLWQRIFNGSYQRQQVISFSITYSCTALFIGFIYEILFLHKEVELDGKIVDQLDLERQYAEMHALRTELDPHFIFNSLTTLSHLIVADPQKAQHFNRKLSQAYKYLLLNKDRDLITLEEELRFIEDYFFLLQIRYDHIVQLQVHLNGQDTRKIMILPCALQILVENAIKHNSFSEKNPLTIKIILQKNSLQVINNVVPGEFMPHSTHTGLKNLRTRYQLLCQDDIMIHKGKEQFLVKIPIIKPNHV